MIKTAVVILNWNGIQWMQKFLGNVVRYSLNPGTEIIVADNASDDGSAEWITDHFREVRLIRFDKNHGFAEGYNRAIGQISARYIVLLNPDADVTPGWLKPLEDYLDNNPDAASCQPKIKSFFRKDYFEYAGAGGGFIDRYGYTFCRGRIFDNVEKDDGQYDNNTDIFWASGACMMVRYDAWVKCGGLDGDFFAHMEEVDLCWRFQIAGFRIASVPESVVYHAGGGVLPYNSELKTYLNFRNNLFMLYKNLPDKNFHNIILTRKLLDGTAALVFLFRGNFRNVRAILKAHIDYYRNLKSLKSKRDTVKRLSTFNLTEPSLNKSLVWEFYIKKNKTYQVLKSKYDIR